MIEDRSTWTAGRRAVLALAGLLLVVAGAAAQEQEAPEEIPQVVMEALEARFPGAEIRQWTLETEDDVVLYDIEFTQDGRKCEADIKEDGRYYNYEVEVAAADLPDPVRQTYETRYPDAAVQEVMKIIRIDGETEDLEGYEVVLETADGKQAEITVAPDGEILESGEEG